MRPTVKVNHQFWFDYSADLVKNSFDKVKQGAEKLETLLKWAFLTYLGGTIFSLGYIETSKIGMLALLASPNILLLIGYWLCHYAQLPVSLKFDARSPDLIREAFIKGSKQARLRLNWAIIVSALGIFIWSLALTLAFGLSNQEKSRNIKILTNDNSEIVLVTANSNVVDTLFVKINSSIRDTVEKILAEDTITFSTQNLPEKFIKVDSIYRSFEVEVGWKENNRLKFIKKRIRRKS